MRGPHITAHLRDQAQTTDGFITGACAAHIQVRKRKTVAGNLQPFCAAGQASCLCLLRQHKKQRLHTSELGEHKALRTFRFMKLRTVYATLLKGNPMPPSLVCSSLNVRIINHMKKKIPYTAAVLQKAFKSSH